MGAMRDVYTAAIERLHALIALLEEEGHNLAASFRAEIDKLRGEAPAVEAEVKADVQQVAVVVENDAAQVAEHAVTAAGEPKA